MCQKEFLLFYMCQLWALHVVVKRHFYIYYVLWMFCLLSAIGGFSVKISHHIRTYSALTTVKWPSAHYNSH